MLFGLCRGLNAKVHVWVAVLVTWLCLSILVDDRRVKWLWGDVVMVWDHCGVFWMIYNQCKLTVSICFEF